MANPPEPPPPTDLDPPMVGYTPLPSSSSDDAALSAATAPLTEEDEHLLREMDDFAQELERISGGHSPVNLTPVDEALAVSSLDILAELAAAATRADTVSTASPSIPIPSTEQSDSDLFGRPHVLPGIEEETEDDIDMGDTGMTAQTPLGNIFPFPSQQDPHRQARSPGPALGQPVPPQPVFQAIPAQSGPSQSPTRKIARKPARLRNKIAVNWPGAANSIERPTNVPSAVPVVDARPHPESDNNDSFYDDVLDRLMATPSDPIEPAEPAAHPASTALAAPEPTPPEPTAPTVSITPGPTALAGPPQVSPAKPPTPLIITPPTVATLNFRIAQLEAERDELGFKFDHAVHAIDQAENTNTMLSQHLAAIQQQEANIRRDLELESEHHAFAQSTISDLNARLESATAEAARVPGLEYKLGKMHEISEEQDEIIKVLHEKLVTADAGWKEATEMLEQYGTDFYNQRDELAIANTERLAYKYAVEKWIECAQGLVRGFNADIGYLFGVLSELGLPQTFTALREIQKRHGGIRRAVQSVPQLVPFGSASPSPARNLTRRGSQLSPLNPAHPANRRMRSYIEPDSPTPTRFSSPADMDMPDVTPPFLSRSHSLSAVGFGGLSPIPDLPARGSSIRKILFGSFDMANPKREKSSLVSSESSGKSPKTQSNNTRHRLPLDIIKSAVARRAQQQLLDGPGSAIEAAGKRGQQALKVDTASATLGPGQPWEPPKPVFKTGPLTPLDSVAAPPRSAAHLLSQLPSNQAGADTGKPAVDARSQLQPIQLADPTRQAAGDSVVANIENFDLDNRDETELPEHSDYHRQSPEPGPASDQLVPYSVQRRPFTGAFPSSVSEYVNPTSPAAGPGKLAIEQPDKPAGKIDIRSSPPPFPALGVAELAVEATSSRSTSETSAKIRRRVLEKRKEEAQKQAAFINSRVPIGDVLKAMNLDEAEVTEASDHKVATDLAIVGPIEQKTKPAGWNVLPAWAATPALLNSQPQAGQPSTTSNRIGYTKQQRRLRSLVARLHSMLTSWKFWCGFVIGATIVAFVFTVSGAHTQVIDSSNPGPGQPATALSDPTDTTYLRVDQKKKLTTTWTFAGADRLTSTTRLPVSTSITTSLVPGERKPGKTKTRVGVDHPDRISRSTPTFTPTDIRPERSPASVGPANRLGPFGPDERAEKTCPPCECWDQTVSAGFLAAVRKRATMKEMAK